MQQILWQKFHAADERASNTCRLKVELQRGERERERERVLATSVAECTQSSAALSLHWIVQGITDRAKLGGLRLFFPLFLILVCHESPAPFTTPCWNSDADNADTRIRMRIPG
ncbi:unnamed protein product [Sphagnum troendelagicum]